MKKTKRKQQLIINSVLLGLLLMLFFAFRPIPKATLQNCTKIIAQVDNIVVGEGENDIVLSIKNDDAYYYINRGLERGLKLQSLQNQLLNKKITLYYIKHWSLLNLNNSNRHIAKIDLNESNIYDEMKK